MFGTYNENDVKILLKDITELVEPMGTKEREKMIQSGVHYSEMLPIEYEPSKEYMEIYYTALKRYSKITANAVANVSHKILKEKGENLVLVSLARAGTSIGVLIKRYIKYKYNIDCKHYTISVIRGVGIDDNAIKYILERHKPQSIQFVDGWTGKGAIQNEVKKQVLKYDGLNPKLAVLSDPANLTDVCGTKEDFLIASSCLNATISGLLSRTFLKKGIIKENDFHGAAFYKNLYEKDHTYEFINEVEKYFKDCKIIEDEIKIREKTAKQEIDEICNRFGIENINFVKPSIGETTRVLLRRIPWKILVKSLDDYEHLGHIYQLSKEKSVEICEYNLINYRACGIIRKLSDN